MPHTVVCFTEPSEEYKMASVFFHPLHPVSEYMPCPALPKQPARVTENKVENEGRDRRAGEEMEQGAHMSENRRDM